MTNYTSARITFSWTIGQMCPHPWPNKSKWCLPILMIRSRQRAKFYPKLFAALWKLSRSGIDVVPITGRCAGWVDHIARFWPVRGVVGENGAFYAYMDYSQEVQKLKKRYFLQPDEVREAKKKFDLIKRDVFKKFPTCKEASDQPYREFDLAIDFREDVPPLSLNQVKEIVKIFEKYGAKGESLINSCQRVVWRI